MAQEKWVVNILVDADTSSAEKGLSALSKSAGGLGKVLGGIATVATAATGAVAGVAASSISVGMDFDKSMAQVAATMGKSVDEIVELRDYAREMGRTTAFSATEAADALNYMALAGYDADTSMQMLPNVLNLAAAGNMDLARASDMVTDTQSALGLSLEETTELVDKMALTSSKSNTNVEQLGEAMLQIGGTAKTLQGGTTELAAALGILADNGNKGAQGGTALRNVLTTIQGGKFEKTFGNLGVKAYDASGKMRPLKDILADMNEVMGDMTDDQKTSLISKTFNVRDLRYINALLDTSIERWGELSEAIDDSEDAASKMAETRLDNLAGDVTLFKSALKDAQIVISDGLTPDLREFVQFGTSGLLKITEGFNEGGLSGAMDAFGDVLAEGLTLVITKLPEFVQAGADLLGALVDGIIENSPAIIESGFEIIRILLIAIIDKIPELVQASIDIIQAIAQGILDNLPLLLNACFEIIRALADGIVESLPELIPTVVDIILEIVETLIDNIDKLVDAAIAIILALADGLINALPSLLEKAPIIVSKLVHAFIENAPKLLAAALELVLVLAKGLIDNIPELLKAALNLIDAIVTGFFDGMGKIVEIGVNIVTGIWDGIKSAAGWLSDKVAGFFGGIIDDAKDVLGIHSPSRVFASIGEYMMRGMAVGIESSAKYAVDATEDALLGLVDAANITIPYPRIGAAKVIAPKIAALANGAVIPPNQEFMAVLGDQRSGVNIESPLSTMVDAFKQALYDFGVTGEGVGDIYIPVYVNNELTTEQIIRRQDIARYRSNGK